MKYANRLKIAESFVEEAFDGYQKLIKWAITLNDEPEDDITDFEVKIYNDTNDKQVVQILRIDGNQEFILEGDDFACIHLASDFLMRCFIDLFITKIEI